MQNSFGATIQTAYDDTAEFFTKLSKDDAYRNFVCPQALHGKPVETAPEN